VFLFGQQKEEVFRARLKVSPWRSKNHANNTNGNGLVSNHRIISVHPTLLKVAHWSDGCQWMVATIKLMDEDFILESITIIFSPSCLEQYFMYSN
jgi:hypothetical protein